LNINLTEGSGGHEKIQEGDEREHDECKRQETERTKGNEGRHEKEGLTLPGLFATCISLNVITMMASNWFGDGERSLAASLGFIWNLLGVGVVFGKFLLCFGGFQLLPIFLKLCLRLFFCSVFFIF
jgi:hypothetical protein